MPRRLLGTGVAVLTLTALVWATTCRTRASDENRFGSRDITETVNDFDEVMNLRGEPAQVIPAAIKKMADHVGRGGNIKPSAAALAKKYPNDLLKLMWVFKPRLPRGGGFGVGPVPGRFKPDGIEGIIITHGNPRRKSMTANDLKAASADFTRLADVTLAMADLIHQYTPKKKRPMMDPKDWTKFTDDMKQGATDLKTAVKANNPNDVKMAFTKLYTSCTNCHAVFRD